MNSDRPRFSAYTPFLRRFTDGRAYDLAETVRLYNRVAAAYRATVWAREDAIEHVSNFVADLVSNIVEVPNYLPIAEALDQCQRELLAHETTIFSEPAVDFFRPLSLREQVDLNRHLRAQEYFLAHQDRISEQLVTALGNVAGGIMQSLPRLAESAFTVPLISLLPNPHDVVDRIIGTIFASDLVDAGLFTAVQDRIYTNMCRFSNVPLDGSSKKPLVTANEADLTPEELVETYLAATPFHSLFFTPIPFSIPEETRFSGMWILAPPGRGKTVLLSNLFLQDIERNASIIIMDSKGDLIDPIKNLKGITDRLIVIEPDQDPALNPLDLPRANVTQVVNNLEYVFGSLLDAKMTALQQTLFRSVLRALIIAFPNPTLETFRDVVANGYKPYVQYIQQLPPDLQEFFLKEFDTKTYDSTREQVNWRLRLLLENEIIRNMFTAPRTKIDMGKEMDTPGRIVLINNSLNLLGAQGCEFFSRYFIAQILASAQARSGRRPEDKLPAYFYIDECSDVIKRDEKFVSILDTCRSQKIAIIAAHQRTAQIESPNVLSALSNCAIRYANSDDEAKFLADKLRTDTEFIRSLPRGTFAAFVRDLTPRALAIKVPYTDLTKLPQITAAERRALRDRMRAQFSYTHEAPGSADASHVGKAASAEAGRPIAPPAPKPAAPAAAKTSATPKPTRSPPLKTATATSPPIASEPANTPLDRGDAGEPADKWG